MKRYAPNLEACWHCRGPMPEGKGRRYRITCSDKCRQARYRRGKGQMSRGSKQIQRAHQARRAVPFIEREFNVRTFKPVYELGYRRHAYECLACGTMYVVERISNGNKARPFCSDACESYSKYRWKNFNAAYARMAANGQVDPRVRLRLVDGKLSPLCKCCGKPFSPNSTLEGKPTRGRPRVWCSDACRKEAYERRWKVKHGGTARGHRYRECLECGTRMDRVDRQGRRSKRFCHSECKYKFMDRAKAARNKAKAKGITEFKRGATGHGAAARGSTKNQRNRDRRNAVSGLSSGKAGEGVWSSTRVREEVGVQGDKITIFTSGDWMSR